MSTVLTILAFLVIFSLLIVIHEFGHFYAAKRSGVKVEEFGFGMPPRIWGFQKGETFYSLNAIPFGGFVRTLGEGEDSSEGRRSKRSFANQTLRVQALIVCAGVVMNFLLSFVLLTTGFVIGMEPLIATEEDFNTQIRAGVVQIEPGIVVVESHEPYRTVDYNGKDLEIRSFEPGDRLLGFEDLQDWEAVTAPFETQKFPEGYEDPWITMNRKDGTGGAEILTPELYKETVFAPTLVSRLVYQAKAGSLFEGKLQEGDVLIRINGAEILNQADLEAALLAAPDRGAVDWTFYRASEGLLDFKLGVPDQFPLISSVEVGSPAEQAGLRAGDEVMAVQGKPVRLASELPALIQAQKVAGTVDLLLSREGKQVLTTVALREADARVGVALADPVPYNGYLSFYPDYKLSTLMKVSEVSYGWKAPQMAVSEMWRLGKITASTFVGVLRQFVTAQGVPAGVSGPVGIAQMTGVTLQEGFSATLRFVAMLSLSLGVINILPFPALDGGHFAIIVYKALSGRKPNPRWEQFIHSAGFIFLLLLIAFITFNDVMNLL